MYKEFLMIFSIIIIHELGHLICALIYKWNLDKIYIYPFGGCVKFNEKLNKPLKEELFILISGPIIQIIFLLIVYTFYTLDFINIRNYLLFKNYNITLLLFNLLPIYPLDGGRIINVLTQYFLPYKKSNLIIILVSIIIALIVIINSNNINLTLMIILLFTELFIFFKQQNYLYNKLLLERYLDNLNFKKLKIIKNKKNIYKEKRHIILDNNKFITEKEYLRKRYDK